MSNDATKAQLTAAKQLIQDKRYDEAYALLQTIDHPTARKWASKLEESYGVSGKSKQKPKRSGNRARNLILFALAVPFICVALIFLIPTGTDEPEALPTQAESVQEVAAQPTENAPVTSTPTPQPTRIPPSATITNTPIPTATNTPEPPTNTPVPTYTPIPPDPVIFSSSELGLQPVIGPVDLPTGIYRVRYTSTGFGIVDIETIGGECITDTFGLFNVSSGEANGGAETIFASDSCSGLITVDNTSEPWTLEFLPVTGLVPFNTTYSSASDGLIPLLGPFEIPDGRYRATFTTTGFGIIDLEPISGTCDTGVFSLFNVSRGEADSGAQSLLTTEECVAFITVDNVSEPWTLDFEQLN